jgi:hypothetical protein
MLPALFFYGDGGRVEKKSAAIWLQIFFKQCMVPSYEMSYIYN